MAVSQNGYSANDRSLIASYAIPGTNRRLTMRKGDVSVVLIHIACWFHHNIEPIDVGALDDWGYAERPIRGGKSLSNHASGTAIDLNATLHPLGRINTFPASARNAINAKLFQLDGVVRWGGNYLGRKDDMHFEINAGSAAVKRVADRIRALEFGYYYDATNVGYVTPGNGSQYETFVNTSPGSRVLDLYKQGSDVMIVQRAVGVKDDGKYGPGTKEAVRKFQSSHGLDADGICGPKTWAAILSSGGGGSANTYEGYVEIAAGKRVLDLYKCGSDVTVVQKKVGVSADAKYGPGTKESVRSWQSRNGLGADGIVGPATWSKILHVATGLKVDGDLGPNTVRALQRALGVAPDGWFKMKDRWTPDFGPNTTRALQRRVGSTADGKMGPNTVRAVQRRLGVTADGKWGSGTTSALQRALNAGKF